MSLSYTVTEETMFLVTLIPKARQTKIYFLRRVFGLVRVVSMLRLMCRDNDLTRSENSFENLRARL